MNGFMDRKSLSLGPTCGSYDDRYFGPIIPWEISYLVTTTCSAYLSRYLRYKKTAGESMQVMRYKKNKKTIYFLASCDMKTHGKISLRRDRIL